MEKGIIKRNKKQKFIIFYKEERGRREWKLAGTKTKGNFLFRLSIMM
jgi:hypothetical protein